MSDLCRLIWCALIGLFRPRAALEAEILVLRHQLKREALEASSGPMLPISGPMLEMFSPLQNAPRPCPLPFSPFQRSPCGGPLADCGGSRASLLNIFRTSSELMFPAGLLESLICPSILLLPSTIMGKTPHSLVHLGKHSPRERIAGYPRLRSAGIWLVRWSNVETRHVRSFCRGHSRVGCDRGPHDLWPHLVS